MDLFSLDFISVSLMDLLDVFIVSVILYKAFSWFKGSRAVQMGLAVLFLILVAIVSSWWEMNALYWILSNIKTVGLVIFFIVFQPEIRRLLITLGGIGLRDIFFKEIKLKIPIDKIANGLKEIKKIKMGALLVIEKRTGLKHLVETGKKFKSEITPEILATIFTNNTPLHDGAVVIQGDSIISAGCVLPLLQNPNIEDRNLGMRHRAALGLSIEVDAVILVVSEETGEISIAYEGVLDKGIPLDKLENKILEAIEK